MLKRDIEYAKKRPTPRALAWAPAYKKKKTANLQVVGAFVVVLSHVLQSASV
jgi:hypothetical protein